ncbi:MAG: nucleotidyl transferase AbiEii/AbiGii toxin family protein [Elusimicrobia bacterium]|nr:nucleotidyl transferase AbiEii/AbiGii toxin family protein [Elusimicrobiota bacterium]
MRDLKKHEQFELAVLDTLNSGRFLNNFVFAGGTMLRLCYGLDRYSVDLDFWTVGKIDSSAVFNKLKNYLSGVYELKDAKNKHFTMLFELKAAGYPRALKVEIRKEFKKLNTEKSIAYSAHSNTQVLLNTLPLSAMMQAKVEAFIDRREIRDVYDIEFMFKRGVKLQADTKTLGKLLKGIENFSLADYRVKLGSILEPEKRGYYRTENFKILKQHINSMLSGKPGL